MGVDLAPPGVLLATLFAYLIYLPACWLAGARWGSGGLVLTSFAGAVLVGVLLPNYGVRGLAIATMLVVFGGGAGVVAYGQHRHASRSKQGAAGIPKRIPIGVLLGGIGAMLLCTAAIPAITILMLVD